MAITVFTNFRIDNPERLQRMKDSCLSMQEIDVARWVVNIRGRCAAEAEAFLSATLGARAAISRVESGDGWFADTRPMLDHIATDYVLYWIEDHICLVPGGVVDGVIDEMRASGAETLMYSFFQFGNRKRQYDGIPRERLGFIEVFDHTRETNALLRSRPNTPYIISLCSIFSTALLRRIVATDDVTANSWPPETPFAAEKSPEDDHWLPVRTALARFELFGCIDDDHITPNSSLMARGMYRADMPRHVIRAIEYGAPDPSRQETAGERSDQEPV